jgi:hypothetical protein
MKKYLVYLLIFIFDFAKTDKNKLKSYLKSASKLKGKILNKGSPDSLLEAWGSYYFY